jgi:hypothetical protein
MTEDEVRERLWAIADQAVRGLVPRPSVSIDIERLAEEARDESTSYPACIAWELEFSVHDERFWSVAEVAFERAAELLEAATELELEGEEFGRLELALTGSIDLA